MYIYVNGEVIPVEKATLSPLDHGFMYGLGLFETFRMYNGHPFLLDDHFLRLQIGLNTLAINWSYKRKDVMTILKSLLTKNNLSDAYVRWNVSAGVGPIGLQTEPYNNPTTIVYMKPIPEKLSLEKEAVLLTTRRNTPEGKERLKSHHFMNNVIGRKELGSDVSKEGIFLTKEGFLAEGIVSNLFWVKNEVVYTPAVETGILNGITRQFILTLLEKEQITFKEGFFLVDELLDADEVFITNSIQEIVPITKLEGQQFSPNGKMINRLQHLYRQHKKTLWSRKDLD